MKFILSTIFIFSAFFLQETFAQKNIRQHIDRELFFEQPSYSDFKLSPDGTKMTFIRYNDRNANIYIKDLKEKTENARPVTNIHHNSSLTYEWTKDGKFIIYTYKADNRYNIQSVLIDEMHYPYKITNLSTLLKSEPVLFHLSEKNPENVFFGIPSNYSHWLDLYQFNLFTGQKEELYTNSQQIHGYYLDWNDNLRLISKADESGNELIITIDLDTIIQASSNEKPDIRCWNKDNNKFYFIANSPKEDLSAIYEYDILSRKTKLIEKDPKNRVDIYDIYIDQYSKKITGTTYFYEKPETYWKSTYWNTVYDSIRTKFNDKNIQLAISDSTKDKIIFTASSDRSTASYHLFDIKLNKAEWIADAHPEIKNIESQLSQTQAFYYKSTDGKDIPAYLTLPNQKKSKKLPLIVLVHDDPFNSRIYWEYQPFVQLLSNRGFAVFQPNYRGSEGYGLKYKESGYQQLGADIQDDITAGVNHLIKQGTADPKHIIIIGTGMGGHAVFTGLQQNPDLYAAGISINGVHNLETLTKSVPEFWKEKQKKYRETIGNPYTKEGLKKLQEQSPFYNNSKINKPLFIIQNVGDVRSRLSETNQLAAQLHKKSKVKYLLTDDRDSNYSDQLIYASIDIFLSETVKTHHKPDITNNTSESIKKHTVQPDSLKFSDLTGFSAQELPKFKFPLKSNEYIYNVELQYDGQSLSFVQYRKIKYANSRWTIQYYSNTPAGNKTELAYYSSTFQPSYKNITGVQEKSEISFADNKVYFNHQYGQNEIKSPSSFLVDGPGLDLVIGNLPLKKGFQTKTYILDESSEIFKPCIVKVTDEEKIQHQDFWVVEIVCVQDPEDKTTLWFNKRNHLLYKSVRKIPSLGNTIITTTLKD